MREKRNDTKGSEELLAKLDILMRKHKDEKATVSLGYILS
jgi:hypothetical protein